MTKWTAIVLIVAILCITGVLISMHLNHIDGLVTAGGISAIAGIAGYTVKILRDYIKIKS